MVRSTKKDVNVNINAKDSASSAFRRVGKGADGLKKRLLGMKTAVAGAFGVLSIGATLKKSLDAFAKQEQAEQRLLKALENRGLATRKNIQDTREAAKALQEVSTVGDETALSQIAVALSMGASVKRAIELTRASADLAAGMNIGIDQAARQLTKTLGGYAGELGEILPEVKSLTKEQLQQGAVIDLVAQKFKGFSASEASTFGGSMQQMRNSVGDLGEEIGKQLAPSILALAGFIKETLVPNLKPVLDGFGALLSVFGKIGGAIVNLAGKVKDFLQPAIDSIRLSFANLASVMHLTFDAASTGNFSGLTERVLQAVRANSENISRTASEVVGRSLDSILLGADTTPGNTGLSGVETKKKAASRALRNTAGLSESRFLTGVTGQSNFLQLQETIAKENQQQTQAQIEQASVLRALLLEVQRLVIPNTAGLFNQTGGL